METGMKSAAIYARVSSDRQKEENTIASQTAALVEFAHKQGYDVPAEWVFEDEGFSGASLVRPALERLRDLAAEDKLQPSSSMLQTGSAANTPIRFCSSKSSLETESKPFS
jgi:site-specific DNA recombinase